MTKSKGSFEADVKKAWGYILVDADGKPTVVKVEGSFTEYGAYADIPENELPDEDDILQMTNAKNKAAAKAKATTKTLATNGYAKPVLDEAQQNLRNMFAVLKKANFDDEVAKATAVQTLKTEWTEVGERNSEGQLILRPSAVPVAESDADAETEDDTEDVSA